MAWNKNSGRRKSFWPKTRNREAKYDKSSVTKIPAIAPINKKKEEVEVVVPQNQSVTMHKTWTANVNVNEEIPMVVEKSTYAQVFEKKFGRPRMIISPKLHALFNRLHDEYKHLEWSGFAKAGKYPWYYVLEDIIFPKQTNQWTLTTIHVEGKEKLFETLIERQEDFNLWNVWFHSHHNMGVFWSGTDHNQMESNGEDGADSFISIVTSYRDGREEDMYLATMNVYKPFRFDIDMNVEIGEYDSKDDGMNLLIESINSRWADACGQARQKILDDIADERQDHEETVATYKEANKKVEADRKLAMQNLDKKYDISRQPTDEELQRVAAILNIDDMAIDEETMKIVIELVRDEWKERKEREAKAVERVFPLKDVTPFAITEADIEERVMAFIEEINEEFSKEIAMAEDNFFGAYIEEKVKELKDAQRTTVGGYPQGIGYTYPYEEKHSRSSTPMFDRILSRKEMRKALKGLGYAKYELMALKDTELTELYNKKFNTNVGVNVGNKNQARRLMEADIADYEALPTKVIEQIQGLIDAGYDKTFIDNWVLRHAGAWEQADDEVESYIGNTPTIVDKTAPPIFGADEMRLMFEGSEVSMNRLGQTLTGYHLQHVSKVKCDACQKLCGGLIIENRAADITLCEECFEKNSNVRARTRVPWQI